MKLLALNMYTVIFVKVFIDLILNAFIETINPFKCKDFDGIVNLVLSMQSAPSPFGSFYRFEAHFVVSYHYKFLW